MRVSFHCPCPLVVVGVTGARWEQRCEARDSDTHTAAGSQPGGAPALRAGSVDAKEMVHRRRAGGGGGQDMDRQVEEGRGREEGGWEEGGMTKGG